MSALWYKSFRGVTLALMLLLTAASNFVCISYDSDEDDDIPPINIELNVVAPEQHNLQTPRAHYSDHSVYHLQDVKPEADNLLASADFSSAPQLDRASSQLLVPLRR